MGLSLVQAEVHLQLDSTVPLTLMGDSRVQGDLEVMQGDAWINQAWTERVRVLGTLHLHLATACTFNQAWNLPGSLWISSTVSEPLSFIADLQAAHHLQIETKSPVIIGDATHAPKLSALGGALSFSTEGALAHIDAATQGQHSFGFYLVQGRLIGSTALRIQSLGDITLGTLQRSVNAQPMAALGSGGCIELITQVGQGVVQWHQLELKSAGLRVQGSYLDNVSSQVAVYGDADFSLDSKHRLLKQRTEKSPAPVQQGYAYWTPFESYKLQGPSERALTQSPTLSITGRLRSTGSMQLFAAQLHCLNFEGSAAALEPFVPFEDWEGHFFGGHRKYNHCQWHKDPNINRVVSPTMTAVFSSGTAVVLAAPSLEIDGILSALSIHLHSIERGHIGHIHLAANTRLAAARPFNPRINLLDYFQGSAFVEPQVGGDTVYRSLLSLTPVVDRGPILVLGADGRLRPNTAGLRRLFTAGQEEELLVRALMVRLNRGFLTETLSEPAQILEQLRHNALAHVDTGDNASQALVLRGAPSARLIDPVIVYEVVDYEIPGQPIESVLVPVPYLPTRFDNALQRSGAGGLFASGDITLEGVPGANLRINGDLQAGGRLRFRQFATLSHEQRMTTREEHVIHTTTTRSLFSRRHRHHTEMVQVTELEPGNHIQASAISYEDIGQVHIAGTQFQVGPGGVQTLQVQDIQEVPLVATRVGAHRQQRIGGMLSSTRSSGARAEPYLIRSRIQSTGHVHFEASNSAHLHSMHIQAPSHTLTAPQRSLHRGMRDFEAALAQAARAEREAERTARRRARQGEFRLIASIVVSAGMGAVAGPVIQSMMGVSATAGSAAGVAAAGGVGATAAGTAGAAAGSMTATAGAASMGVAAGSAVAAGTAAAVAVPTLTLMQSIVLGAGMGASAGVAGALVRGTNPLQGMLRGAAFAGVGGGVSNALGQSAQELSGQLIQAASTATLQTVFEGGNLLENMGLAIAGNAVAHTLLPMDSSSVADLTRWEFVRRNTGNALLRAGTVSMLGGSDDFAMNMAIAAIGGVIAPLAESAGTQLGSSLVQGMNQQRQDRAVLNRVRTQLPEPLSTQGTVIVASQARRTIQSPAASQALLLCTPSEAQARLVEMRGADAAARVSTNRASITAMTGNIRNTSQDGTLATITQGTEISGAEWLRQFSVSAVQAGGAVGVIALFAQNPQLLLWLQRAGWVGVSVAAGQGMHLVAQFERDNFGLSESFDEIMRNPMISESIKQALWSADQARVDHFAGQPARPFWQMVRQVVQEHPSALGSLVGGGWSMVGVERAVRVIRSGASAAVEVISDIGVGAAANSVFVEVALVEGALARTDARLIMGAARGARRLGAAAAVNSEFSEVALVDRVGSSAASGTLRNVVPVESASAQGSILTGYQRYRAGQAVPMVVPDAPISTFNLFENHKIVQSRKFKDLMIRAHSTPAEIHHGHGALSARQSRLLDQLPRPNDLLMLKKSDINVTDLAALTAKTGDEFALFTLGSRRIVIRGTNNNLQLNNVLLEKLQSEHWTWSAHTHPGTRDIVLNASGQAGDRGVLQVLEQDRSLILNSAARRNIFDAQDNLYLRPGSNNTISNIRP